MTLSTPWSGRFLAEAVGAMAMAIFLLPVPTAARPRVLVVAQLELKQAPPVPMRQPAITTPQIDAERPETQQIRPRPTDDAPKIVAPPVTKGVLSSRDGRDPAVEKELQRLLRQAETPRGFGATPASAQAAWQLGLVYLHGSGVRRDPALAQRWFERAAQFSREPWAYAGLAWCHIDGCIGPPDAAAATRFIALLRPQRPARADFLAWVLASRQTPLQVAQPSMMQDQILQLPNRQLLERSAAAGDMHANIELGIDAVTRKQIAQAETYFRRAGPNSAAAAANLQEIQSRDDVLVGRSPPTSANASASEALAAARKYHRGEGVPANFVEAIRLYRLADARGSVEARRMLALIYSRPMPDGSINPGWMQQLAYVDATTSIPTVGIRSTTHMLHREPTPLFDLLPSFWRQQMTQVDR